jgi:hypothetical protein
MNAFDGHQYDELTFPKRMEKLDRLVSLLGKTNWFKKWYVRFLRHTTNLNFLTAVTVSDQSADATRL